MLRVARFLLVRSWFLAMHLELVAEIPEIAGKLSARRLVHLFLISSIEPALIICVLLSFQHVFELDRIHL